MKKSVYVEKPLKTKVSLTLDWDTIERLRALAQEDDRALSSYINLILRDYLRKLDKEAETGLT